jgi:hypothetical protein
MQKLSKVVRRELTKVVPSELPKVVPPELPKVVSPMSRNFETTHNAEIIKSGA